MRYYSKACKRKAYRARKGKVLGFIIMLMDGGLLEKAEEGLIKSLKWESN